MASQVTRFYTFYTIEISTLVIIAFLLVAGLIFRKEKSREMKRILQIAVFAGLISAETLFFEYFNSTLSVALQSHSAGLCAFVVAILLCVKEFFTLLIILFWNLYVDFCLYKSDDHVRKKMRWSLILVCVVSGTFTLIYVPLCILSPASQLPVVIWNLFIAISLSIQLFYVINAIWIVWSARKRRQPPTFLRLDLFLIPIAVGYALSLIPEFPDIRNLSYAIAVLLTWITLRMRGRYVDPTTGFYNQTFLRSMNEYMEKRGFPNGVGVLFKVPEHGEKLIPILDGLKPSDAEIFFLGENACLLMSGPQKESVLRLLIKTVKLKTAQEDKTLTISTAFAIREKEESMEDFTRRLLELTPAG